MKICFKTHQIAPFKIFLGESYASEPPKQTCGYATGRKPLHSMQLAQLPKKVGRPLDKSCIRPWTTTKKFI